MYSDVIYCLNCKKAFKDTWVLHDSRIEKVMLRCPHCKSINTINATKAVRKYREGNDYNIYLKIMFRIVKENRDKFKKLDREIIFYNNKVIEYVNDKGR